jgi:hypothetical protein
MKNKFAGKELNYHSFDSDILKTPRSIWKHKEEYMIRSHACYVGPEYKEEINKVMRNED